MRTVKFKAGDTILTEGEQGDTAFLIVDGSVEITIGEGAKAKHVGVLAGEVFGEMSLIDPSLALGDGEGCHRYRCVVPQPRRVQRLDPDRPRSALRSSCFVRRLRQMNEKMASMHPGKRGLRELPRVVKSMQPNENDPGDIHWHDVLSRIGLGRVPSPPVPAQAFRPVTSSAGHATPQPVAKAAPATIASRMLPAPRPRSSTIATRIAFRHSQHVLSLRSARRVAVRPFYGANLAVMFAALSGRQGNIGAPAV
jgi:hypothetical protein